jgi:hypothetical protein
MEYTRESAVERLLKSYQPYYNVHRFSEEEQPLTARCEYFEHSQKYVVSKKVELWSSNTEEFLYIFNVPRLTLDLFEKWRDFVLEDGMSRLNIGPGHMCSYITPVFVCDSCDEDAKKALKKCRIYKSFHFSLHGWMDYHAAVVDLGKGKITANGSGHSTAKILKKVLCFK